MKKALIIGINNYPQKSLNYCENDAIELSKILKDNADKSPNFEIICKTKIQSKAELKNLISKLFNEGNNIDISLFYFSGHGYINELGGYIVTPDFQKYDEGVSMDEILSFANQSASKNRIIILDCCHSGTMGSLNITNNITIIKEGLTILTSCKASEYAVEINGHGVFTNLLIEALKGGAADLRGNITPGSIYSYIDRSLGAWDQRPVFKTNITQFVSIRTTQPQVSIEIIRKLCEYFTKPEDEIQLNPSFEFTNTLNYKNELREPYGKQEKILIFKNLQKLTSIGLITPINEEHMYFAAMNSKSCKLTPLGQYYWRLAKDGRI
ncbi:MAG: caspase family protein [Elusimicrobiota bacterium]|jgi:uncharacterized caspase-like protein|nr:caspase family protein [Elusimicrobiota bacterium]